MRFEAHGAKRRWTRLTYMFLALLISAPPRDPRETPVESRARARVLTFFSSATDSTQVFRSDNLRSEESRDIRRPTASHILRRPRDRIESALRLDNKVPYIPSYSSRSFVTAENTPSWRHDRADVTSSDVALICSIHSTTFLRTAAYSSHGRFNTRSSCAEKEPLRDCYRLCLIIPL